MASCMHNTLRVQESDMTMKELLQGGSQCNKPEPPEVADQGVGQNAGPSHRHGPSHPHVILGPKPRPTRVTRQKLAACAPVSYRGQ
jgi:hypothetical protein